MGASLTLEKSRCQEFIAAMRREEPTPLRSNFIKGSASGLGQLCQYWTIALLFWWGGWLINNHPRLFSFRDFNISMWSLLYGVSGMSVAMQGATDRQKANEAASRVFAMIDRQ